MLALCERLPVERIRLRVPPDRDQNMIVRPSLLLRLQDANVTLDPCPIANEEAVPAPSELGGVKVVFIRHREEQAMTPVPMLDEGSHVQAQVEG